MDGPSFPSRGITPRGAQPAISLGPSLPGSGRAASSSGAPQVPPHTTTPAAITPACVVDFSGSGPGSYVLDWRDPATKQVLVQVPMRTAFASFAGADKTATAVGQQVNTKI